MTPQFTDKEAVALAHDCLSDINADDVFALRKFDGEFRVDRSRTYLSEGVVQLIVQRRIDEAWVDFSRTTVGELTREVVR